MDEYFKFIYFNIFIRMYSLYKLNDNIKFKYKYVHQRQNKTKRTSSDKGKYSYNKLLE